MAVSEGIHYADGTYINDVKTAAADGFGHVQLGGLAVYLANMVKHRLGYKARGIELSLLQRCAAHIASQTDLDESYAAGRTAVERAIGGESDCMIGFTRSEGAKYHRGVASVPLTETANAEKRCLMTGSTKQAMESLRNLLTMRCR